MKIAVFDTHHFDRAALEEPNQSFGFELTFLQDDVLARLVTFPNVIITSHQAFLTREALANIASTTLANVRTFAQDERLVNEVRLEN